MVVKTRCRGHLDQFLDDSKGAKVDVIFLFRRGVEGKNASEERRSVVETGGIDGRQKRWCRDGLLKNERPIIQFLSVFSPGLSPSRYLSKFFCGFSTAPGHGRWRTRSTVSFRIATRLSSQKSVAPPTHSLLSQNEKSKRLHQPSVLLKTFSQSTSTTATALDIVPTLQPRDAAEPPGSSRAALHLASQWQHAISSFH